MSTPLTDLTLPVLDEEGKILDPRIKNVDAARSLWVKTRDADLQSNRMMAKVQALLDGEPPLPQQKLNEMGQGYLSNFNPGDAKALLLRSVGAFSDMLAANPQIFDIFLKKWDPALQDSTLQEWQQIMSEENGLVLRSWSPFMFRHSFITLYMTWHGVAVSYFNDRKDWRWNVSHLGYFKIPRQTKASESEIEYAFVKVETQPHDLLRYIKEPEYAAEEGWKVPAVRRALMNTKSPTSDVHNWMDFEARWKNNDLVEGETAPSISVIHLWVREADSTYSLYMFTEDGLNNSDGVTEDFLCVKRHAFKNANEAFTFFTREIGTNGTYHSVRGLGADMFNAYHTLMRLKNRQADLAFSAGPVFQAATEEAIENITMTPFGPFMLVSDGVQAMQGIQTPNLNNTIQPVVNSLEQTITRNSSSYTDLPLSQPTQERSKFEVMTDLEQQAQLSVTAINLYYTPADRLAREVVRRMSDSDYDKSDPGGCEVWEWRQRCLERGVPASAFDHIDHRRTRAARVIGFGSPAARRMSLESLKEWYPEYDEVGRANLVRNATAAAVGWEQADSYAPRPSASARPPIDYAIADLQNAALSMGQPQAILPNENFNIHLGVHIGKINELVGRFEEAGQNPEIYPQIVPPLQAIYEHSEQTLEQYQGPEAPMYRQALQNAGEILVNGIRHMQKMEQQQQTSPEGAPQQEDDSDEMLKQVIEFQTRLKMNQTEFEQKQQNLLQESALKRSLKAAETAADIGRKNASARAQSGLR